MRFGIDASRRPAKRAQHWRLTALVHRLRQRVEVALDERRDRGPGRLGVTFCASHDALVDAQGELWHIRIVTLNDT